MTGAFENTLKWRTVANATVAASLNSTQYAFSAAYKGQNLSCADYAINVTGGVFAGADTAFISRKLGFNQYFDDFVATPVGTYLGGAFIPQKLGKLPELLEKILNNNSNQ